MPRRNRRFQQPEMPLPRRPKNLTPGDRALCIPTSKGWVHANPCRGCPDSVTTGRKSGSPR